MHTCWTRLKQKNPNFVIADGTLHVPLFLQVCGGQPSPHSGHFYQKGMKGLQMNTVRKSRITKVSLPVLKGHTPLFYGVPLWAFVVLQLSEHMKSEAIAQRMEKGLLLPALFQALKITEMLGLGQCFIRRVIFIKINFHQPQSLV